MSVDLATVKRVAHLARIAVSDEDAERMTGELNAILGFVEQLNEVDVSGVEPMTSVTPMAMKKRAGRRHRRRQGRRHRRQRAGDRRRTSSSCRRWWSSAMAVDDRGRNAAAGRRARAGRGAERVSDPADAARVPVPADRRADGRPGGHRCSSRATRRRGRRLGALEGPWRRRRRGEAHVHAAGGARPARSAQRILQRIEALARDEGHCPPGAGDRRSAGFEPAWRVYERGGFTRCGAGARLSRLRLFPLLRKEACLMTDLTRLTIAEARDEAARARRSPPPS